MGKYAAEKPKVYELAKELGLSNQEFLEILSFYGLPYKGFNATVNETLEELLEIFNGGGDKNSLEREVNLIGMYFNTETRQYHVAEVRLTKKQFDLVGGKVHTGEGTVYNAHAKFRLVTESSGVLKPYKSNRPAFMTKKSNYVKLTPSGKIRK
jgi:hypothetical protein